MLSLLLKRAALDAGFDLEPEREGDWWRIRTSGMPGTAWIQPTESGVLLGVPLASQLEELGVDVTQHARPPGAQAVTHVPDARTLWRLLSRLRILLNQSIPRLSERLERELAKLDTTEAEKIVRQRVGQDLFRQALLEYWEHKCAVCSIAIPELLRASHSKPWANCTDQERLDVHNGLLLAVHLDALFDRGYLTFDDSGTGMVSPLLDESVFPRLGIQQPIRLRFVRPAHLPYLKYHREHVWKGSREQGS